MKKGILLVVFCALTTVSFAQKKKGKVAEQQELEKDAITYVVLQAIEMPNFDAMADFQNKEMEKNPELQMKVAMELMGETRFQFSVLDRSSENSEIFQSSIERAEDLSTALNIFGKLGYEVESAYALEKNGLTVHYFVFAKEND